VDKVTTRTKGCSAGRGQVSVGIKLAAVLVVILGAPGCTTQQQQSGPADISTGRPVNLAPRSDPGSSETVTRQNLNAAELRKALERYRISLERDQSPVETAGVDLTGDGRPEALALFTGPDWCTTTGCSFVVFRETETGYQPVSRTTRVRGPVKVGPGSNAGWRDLLVQTGGGAAPIRFVRLGFTGDGYPNNALLQPGPTDEVLARSTEVIAEVPVQAQKSQASSAR